MENKNLKIAVDARMIKMSGIGTYIQNLMKNGCYDVAFGNEQDIKQIDSGMKTIPFNEKIYGIKEQLKFPYKKLKREKIDVLHVPHYNVPIFYRGKLIVTIHDLTHLILPNFLPNKFAKYYAKFMMWLAIKKACVVLTVSDNSKKDIIKTFRVNPEKIIVIPNGVGNTFIKKDKENINYLYERFNIPRNKKVLMYVGNLKPHKNLERLLQAYSKIENINEVSLVLVGKAFEKYNILEQKEKDLNIEKNVIHTGIVTDDELVDLYNLADLFVFPSLYEGFGLPILEALRCGTPVISSNTSSMKEVGGDVANYFDPYSVEEIKNMIEEHINDKEKFDYKKALNMCNKFDWKISSEKFNKIVKER